MEKIRFIHAADLHLDSPMAGLKHLPSPILNQLRESTFSSLSKIAQAAISNKVNFVILAGDLFDGEDRSLKAQSRFRREMEKLNEREIPVYVIHGNHDHLGGSWVRMDMPANVHIFGSEVEVFRYNDMNGTSVNIYGFSYPSRHVSDKRIDQYVKKEDADFHIGVLHGNDGSSSEHGSYCPFTIQELSEKQFDYWALGHIHKRAELSENPPAIYPGNIQGRNRKETGPKGCYLVEMESKGSSWEFIETADILWEESRIDAKGAESFDEIYQACLAEINQFRRSSGGVLLSLSILNVQLNDSVELNSLYSGLLELLQDGETDGNSFVWVFKVDFTEDKNWSRKSLSDEADFYSELFKTSDESDNMIDTISALYSQEPGRRYLSALSPAESKELIKEAEDLLVKLLRNP